MKILPVFKWNIKQKNLISTPKTTNFSEKETKYYLKWVKNIPKILKGSQILIVNDKKDINFDKIGSHFNENVGELVSNYPFSTDCKEKYFLIEVEIPKNEVDIEKTVKNNVIYPKKQKIIVKNEKKNVKILKIQEINIKNHYFW
jgi:hypothetical protein